MRMGYFIISVRLECKIQNIEKARDKVFKEGQSAENGRLET